MSFQMFMGWMQIAQIAIPLGIATAQEISGLIRAAHATQLTEEQLNTALALIFDDATRRKALAMADATGQPAAPVAPLVPPFGAGA